MYLDCVVVMLYLEHSGFTSRTTQDDVLPPRSRRPLDNDLRKFGAINLVERCTEEKVLAGKIDAAGRETSAAGGGIAARQVAGIWHEGCGLSPPKLPINCDFVRLLCVQERAVPLV